MDVSSCSELPDFTRKLCRIVSKVRLPIFRFMAFWRVELNAVSMITIVMSIGLSIDYSSHLVHSYLIAPGDSTERIVTALQSIGLAVSAFFSYLQWFALLPKKRAFSLFVCLR